MLMIRTTLGQSPIHGLGIFAAEPVAAGQVVWAFDPVFDRIIPMEQFAAYPDHVRAYLEHFCEYFPELGVLVLSGDDDRFTNHADDPNTDVAGENGPQAQVVATRDIAPGEEITCHYGVIRSLKWSMPRTEVA